MGTGLQPREVLLACRNKVHVTFVDGTNQVHHAFPSVHQLLTPPPVERLIPSELRNRQKRFDFTRQNRPSSASESNSPHNGCCSHHRYSATTPDSRPRYWSGCRLRHGQPFLVRLPHAPNQRPRCLLLQVGGRACRKQAVGSTVDKREKQDTRTLERISILCFTGIAAAEHRPGAELGWLAGL